MVGIHSISQPAYLRAAHSTTTHGHSYFEFALVLEGKCTWCITSPAARVQCKQASPTHVKATHSTKKTIIELQQGQALLLAPQARHYEQTHDQSATVLWCAIQVDLAAALTLHTLCGQPLEPDTNAWSCVQSIDREISSSRGGAVDKCTPPLFQEHMMRLLLQQLLIHYARSHVGTAVYSIPTLQALSATQPSSVTPSSGSRDAKFGGSALQCLVRDAQDSNRSVDEVARQLGMSAATLRRYTQRHFDQTPQELRNHQRLQQATRLLREGTLSIKEVAHRCGFNDPAYFSRWFRRHQGETASHYMRIKR